ncbi:MAG: hypothetical protein ACSW8I_07265 [bacterium]
MPLTRFVFSILVVSLLLSACKMRQGDDSPVVASVYDRQLHESALVGIVPPGIPHDDSLAVLDNYVEQWIRQNVLLVKAEKNVKEDFSRQLSEYRDNLVIYTYERQIVDQLLDTVVSSAEVEEYYRQHKDDFLLKNSIVKTVYLSVPVKSHQVAKIKKIISRPNFDEGDIVELQHAAAHDSRSAFYDAETWIPLHTLLAAVPATAYNEALFLRQHRTITLSDDTLFYAARVLDYMVTDDVSPLELQRDNIRAIIINRRKIDILNRLHADLLSEAEEGGHVKRIKN